MKFRRILKKAEKLTIDNSPAILTGVGVAGFVVSAYLTGRSTFKAAALIAKEEAVRCRDEPITSREKFELVWKQYIPPVTVGLTSIACIIFAKHVGHRRATALAAAYSISERAFEEYRDKVVEKFGSQKETAVRDEIAQDRVDRHPPSEVVLVGGSNVLCMDAFSGRYFYSDMETIRRAENDLNREILSDWYITLSDYYDTVGLPHTSYSDEVGWNMDHTIKLEFSATLAEGKPCMVVEFRVNPIREYSKFG